jgi:hypothetical protein
MHRLTRSVGLQAGKLTKLRRLKGTILACLSRDAAQRPSARELINSWERFFDVSDTGKLQ